MPLVGGHLRRTLTRATVAASVLSVAAVPAVMLLGGSDGVFPDVVLPALLELCLAGAIALCVLRAVQDPQARLTWAAFATAIGLWALGEALRATVYPGDRPVVTVVEVLYFGFYPFVAIGAVSLLRCAGPFRRSLAFDGAIAAAACSALTVAVLFPLLDRAAGGADAEALVLIKMAFAVADATLLAVLVAGIGLSPRRPSRELLVVVGALLLYAVCDTAYAVVSATGHELVLWIGAGWGIALVSIGLASSVPAAVPQPARGRGMAMFAIPLGSGLVCIALLLAGNLVDLTDGAASLAAAALVLGIVRTGVTFRENLALADSRRQAVTDELTGLANRRALVAALRGAFAALDEGATPAVGLLLIDLDRFKVLNDTLGHAVGDELLSALGPRLRQAAPEADVVARLGGDEFAVLLSGDLDADALAGAGARVHGALDAPFLLDGLELRAGGSVGGALAPHDAAEAGELVRHADVAMYEAKRAGRAYASYREDGRDRSSACMRLADELRRAGADAA